MTCYCNTNFKTGKALREAVKAGTKVTVRELKPTGEEAVQEGTVAVCGPRYPEPHKWYAQVVVKDGVVVQVKK